MNFSCRLKVSADGGRVKKFLIFFRESGQGCDSFAPERSNSLGRHGSEADESGDARLDTIPGLTHPRSSARNARRRYAGGRRPPAATDLRGPRGRMPNSRKPKLPRFSARTISQPASPFPFFDPEAGRRGGVYKIPSRRRRIRKMDKQAPILDIFAIFP